MCREIGCAYGMLKEWLEIYINLALLIRRMLLSTYTFEFLSMLYAIKTNYNNLNILVDFFPSALNYYILFRIYSNFGL